MRGRKMIFNFVDNRLNYCSYLPFLPFSDIFMFDLLKIDLGFTVYYEFITDALLIVSTQQLNDTWTLSFIRVIFLFLFL